MILATSLFTLTPSLLLLYNFLHYSKVKGVNNEKNLSTKKKKKEKTARVFEKDEKPGRKAGP